MVKEYVAEVKCGVFEVEKFMKVKDEVMKVSK